MFRIHAPRPINTTVAGVKFTNGVGQTDDPDALRYFRRHAYVIEAPASVSEAPFPAGEPSPEWKADQLRAYATHHGIDLAGATSKTDMVHAIQAARK